MPSLFMRNCRSRLEKARGLLSRTDLIATRAQHTETGPASTSGRSAETFASSPGFQAHSDLPASKLPWGILAAGSCVISTGIGWTWGRFGNQALIPDFTSQLDWSHLRQTLSGTASWLRDVSPPNSGGNNFLADAAAKAMPAVVNIHHGVASAGDEADASERTCGSGFLVDPSGLIITNAHVVENALERLRNDKRKKGAPLQVMLQDGRNFGGEVLSLDRVSDLAMIKICSKEPLPTAKIGHSRDMRVGEWVLALGSPLTLQNSVTAGIVSCVGRKANELGIVGRSTSYIQTDAAINTGNSGGPLINLAGEVVGISCMKALFSSGVSFAIPIDAAREIVEQMKAQGRVVRPHIGIKMLQLNSQNAAQMHEKDSRFPASNRGILVPSVLPESPAAKAGLRQGDIITGFGKEFATVSIPELLEVLKQHIGKPLRLKVQRGPKTVILQITAVEAKNDY